MWSGMGDVFGPERLCSQAATRPSRADPGEAPGARDRGGVYRRARAAAIAARSRAGRNSAAMNLRLTIPQP
jgi:hypothetical protein